MINMDALWREDATFEETIEVYQHMIDTGQAWFMDGFTGRTAMSLIEDGYCTLGPERVKDYWGNTVPAITDVVPGSKGSAEYAAERMAER